MCSSVIVIVGLVAIAAALPTQDDLMFHVGDDTAVVESTVREARAAPEHIDDLLKPGVKEAFLHTYGDDEANTDGDAQGYRKRTSDKGSDGYSHFDSYHKKDGDKYGYATSSEFGQENKSGVKPKKSAKKGSRGAETKKSYKVVEEGDDNKKGTRAVEDYEGEAGFYADSGEGGSYTEGGEGGYEGEGGYYEGEGGSEGASEGASEGGDGESYSEYDEESESDGDDY